MLARQTTAASVSGSNTGMHVVSTPLLGALVLRARLGATTWTAVALATTGLGLLSLQSSRSALARRSFRPARSG